MRDPEDPITEPNKKFNFKPESSFMHEGESPSSSNLIHVEIDALMYNFNKTRLSEYGSCVYINGNLVSPKTS